MSCPNPKRRLLGRWITASEIQHQAEDYRFYDTLMVRAPVNAGLFPAIAKDVGRLGNLWKSDAQDLAGMTAVLPIRQLQGRDKPNTWRSGEASGL
jgi:hypothetical protein